ncbi:MAG: MMPL family transporter [Carboxylicivirga sp.]|jgi:predicted RND superfamily exporter protein|nr:MMPL family transporter [Carboxylicivirga sp.]
MKKIIGRYKYWVIFITIFITILSATQLTQLRINPGFEKYIPAHVGNRAFINELNNIFGGSEKVMLILNSEDNILNAKSYHRLEQLTIKLKELDGIENCLSILDAIEFNYVDGFSEINPLISDIPNNLAEKDFLKRKILKNPMGKRFVSDDFKATAIILTKSNAIADNVLIPSIEKVIDTTPGKEEIYVGGLSYIRQSIKSYIKSDLVFLLPLALILMIVMLYFSFREWKGVILPFLIVILSIILSFAIMAVMHWEISLISVLLPIMLIAIANDYGIHLINLYQEKAQANSSASMKEIAIEIFQELKKPIIITALTTIGGMLGLLSHDMPPAAELGLLSAAGIGIALILSLYLIPLILAFAKRKRSAKAPSKPQHSFVDQVLECFTQWVTKYNLRVILVFTLVSLISIAGLFNLRVDTNVEEYFIGKSDIKKGIDLVNDKFGGSQYVSILFKGDVLAPDALQRIETYTKEIEKLPTAVNIISPSVFFKELSKGMFAPGDVAYNNLPNSKAEAIQYLEIFSMSGFDEQIAQFIDYNYEHSRILVSMKDGSNQTGKAILKALADITKNDPQLVSISGPGLSKIQIADMVINGQKSSLMLAFAIIFVLLTLIFRSFTAGLHASLPLLLSTLFLFGIMGLLDIPLDIATTLLSSIMIGVGVDYTIHFIWRYKREYAITQNIDLAISNTFKTTGRGIVFNAMSVIIGFSALIFSNFAPLRFFGLLVVISIFSCLICALLLIPAIIKTLNPAYLKK